MPLKVSILLCFITLNVFSQRKIYVKDFEKKHILPFASIRLLNENKGLYANDQGAFFLSEINGDSIEVSYLGYFPLKLKKQEIKDTIFLNENFELLREVIVITGQSSKKLIGYIKNKKSLSWYIRHKTELSTLIKNKKVYDKAYIRKIHIPIGKKQIKLIDNKYKETHPKFNNVIRVNLYSNLDGRPGKVLLANSILIECTQDTNEIIEIDIANDFIEYPRNGVFVGVEMIGELDKDRNLINKKETSTLPSFKFTKKKKNSVFSTSFIRTIFFDNNWVSIENKKDFSQVAEYNMAIGLTLDVYKK